jgi:hypothetical protein
MEPSRKQDARKDAGMTSEGTPEGYQPPELRDLGSVVELTQACFKWFGGSDGLFFIDVIQTVCVSR